MSRSRLWSLLVFGLAFALGIASCSQGTQEGESGSLSLELTIGGDIEVDEVRWLITGGDMDAMSETIDTSAPGATASVEVFGLPATVGEDYTIVMEADGADGTTCRGSEDFGIDVGEVTEIEVFLNCKRPQRLGAVRVNGKFNICAELVKATASPLQTSVGNRIDLTSQAEDAEDDTIAYSWTATGGSIADPDAASTTYTCGEVGDHTITISVTDNDEYCDMATWTFDVTCVPGEVECEIDDDCDAGEICVDNECVLDVECVTPADCDDENDCTNDICADGTCANPNSDIDDMCDQDGGSVCDGQGECVECNSDMQCDAGEVCTLNTCVADVECVMDSECDDGRQCTMDKCNEGVCENPNEPANIICDEDGGSFCDFDGNCVECTFDENCPIGEVCVGNMCVADVECMENDDCGVDEICVDNECVADGGACDETASDACVGNFCETAASKALCENCYGNCSDQDCCDRCVTMFCATAP